MKSSMIMCACLLIDLDIPFPFTLLKNNKKNLDICFLVHLIAVKILLLSCNAIL